MINKNITLNIKNVSPLKFQLPRAEQSPPISNVDTLSNTALIKGRFRKVSTLIFLM